MIRAQLNEIELTGLAAELEQELEPLMIQAVDAGTEVLLKEVQTLLSNSSSRPGGPPAKVTGELHDSMATVPAKKRKRYVEGRVQVSDPDKKRQGEIARKAAALEYGGTDKKGRVHPAYPFARLAEVKAEDRINDAIDRVLSEGE